MTIKKADIKEVTKSMARLPEDSKELTVPGMALPPDVTHDNPEYFRPTVKQRKLKEAFRTACKNLPTNRMEITKEFILQHVTSKDLDTWWGLPGFKPWFRKDEAIAERLNHLYQLRLDAIEAVLADDSNVFTAKDKIQAGAQLDSIAKAMVDAAEVIQKDKWDMRSYEDKVKDALAKVRSADEKKLKEPEKKKSHLAEIMFPGEEDK